jgi:hypothetical protein
VSYIFLTVDGLTVAGKKNLLNLRRKPWPEQEEAGYLPGRRSSSCRAETFLTRGSPHSVKVPVFFEKT